MLTNGVGSTLVYICLYTCKHELVFTSSLKAEASHEIGTPKGGIGEVRRRTSLAIRRLSTSLYAFLMFATLVMEELAT